MNAPINLPTPSVNELVGLDKSLQNRLFQYAICKQRGHQPSTVKSPPWETCRFCGTSYRTVVKLQEIGAPKTPSQEEFERDRFIAVQVYSWFSVAPDELQYCTRVTQVPSWNIAQEQDIPETLAIASIVLRVSSVPSFKGNAAFVTKEECDAWACHAVVRFPVL